MRNVCLVLVPDGADSLLSLLIKAFHECAQDKNGDTPYEFVYVVQRVWVDVRRLRRTDLVFVHFL